MSMKLQNARANACQRPRPPPRNTKIASPLDLQSPLKTIEHHLYLSISFVRSILFTHFDKLFQLYFPNEI